MMSMHTGRFIALLAVTSLVSVAAKANFEPLFRLSELTGSCRVSKPGKSFADVEEAKAYPYGSTVQTGPDSSMIAILADGTTVRVLPGSTVAFTGKRDGKTRSVQLKIGSIEVTVGTGVEDDESLIASVLPTANVTGRKCKFRIDAAMEGELAIAFVRALKGSVSLSGPHYDVVMLPEGGQVSLLTPPDMQFIRLKNMKGEYPIMVKDSTGSDKEVATKEGNVLKIWREPVADSDAIAVTVLVTDSNGVLLETISSTQKKGSEMGPTEIASLSPTEGATDDGGGTGELKAPKPQNPDRPRPAEAELNRSSYRAPTTGTTTVPPVTPIGTF